MSEFHVEVVKIKDVQKHPNADTLCLANANGYPVIFRTGDFQEGDLAVYCPVDSIVPDTEQWAFLAGHRRIKAKRLRGIFSMGVLAKAQPDWEEGRNVQAEMGIEKYEPPIDISTCGDNESDPGFLPVFTDIEGYRRYPDILVEGEEVVLTEKIHGANSRFLYKDERLWIGSHTCIKKPDSESKQNIWQIVAKRWDLASLLSKYPNIAIYGEVYGQVQDLKYGKKDLDFVLFDAMDVTTRKYFDYDDFLALARDLGLPTAEELYRGPWNKALLSLAEGKTTIEGADHVREGFVVKPVKERFDLLVGRVCLKMVGEGYLLRKEK
jgi:RNA ligase (TIGR02306 family)